MPTLDDPIFAAGVILAKMQAARGRPAEDEDGRPAPEPLTECERWLLRLTGTNSGRFTPAQRQQLRKPYHWVDTVAGGKLIATDAPAPVSLYEQEGPQGADFRRYVEAAANRIRNRTTRISRQALIGVVRGWRYDAKRGTGGVEGVTRADSAAEWFGDRGAGG